MASKELKMVAVQKDGTVQLTYEGFTTRVLTLHDTKLSDAILSAAEQMSKDSPSRVFSGEGNFVLLPPCRDCTKTSVECTNCDPTSRD